MAVAEGRRIAFEEVRRLRTMPTEELMSLPRDTDFMKTVRSGKQYKVNVWVDASEVEQPPHPENSLFAGVVVAGRGIRRLRPYREYCPRSIGGEQYRELKVPTTRFGEFRKDIFRVILLLASPLIAIAALAALILFTPVALIQERISGRRT